MRHKKPVLVDTEAKPHTHTNMYRLCLPYAHTHQSHGREHAWAYSIYALPHKHMHRFNVHGSAFPSSLNFM